MTTLARRHALLFALAATLDDPALDDLADIGARLDDGLSVAPRELDQLEARVLERALGVAA